MLNRLDQLPPGILEYSAHELHSLLGGPTLIRIAGGREPPLFVSVLIHGNETTGWDAIRYLLRQYRPGGGKKPLPRTLWLFIANTAAAAKGVRHLQGQPDYNRIWPGTGADSSHETQMMEALVNECAKNRLFVSVDVHNNTGLNPHYGCINQIRNADLHLASMFSRTIVYFTRPLGVQSIAMSGICPAVTLECGKVGQQHSIAHASEYLDACLHLSEHPAHPLPLQDAQVFHTRAIVKIVDGISVGFGDSALELCLRLDLERLNFRELPSGTSLGTVPPGLPFPVQATDEQGRDITADMFYLEAGKLITKRPLMPSMLTP
ncbi:MAG: M14 family metallopeptidase, partial [Pseudohongiellaceae bacterium]